MTREMLVPTRLTLSRLSKLVLTHPVTGRKTSDCVYTAMKFDLAGVTKNKNKLFVLRVSYTSPQVICTPSNILKLKILQISNGIKDTTF